jgi:hypothetical protein
MCIMMTSIIIAVNFIAKKWRSGPIITCLVHLCLFKESTFRSSDDKLLAVRYL